MPDVFGFLDSISSPRLPRKIRGFLNLVFVGSITSFCFEIAYFEYSLIDFLNYEQIYRFFIGGNFILPFSIFYFIWWTTDILAALIFKRPNNFLAKTLKPFFLNFLKRKWKTWNDSANFGRGSDQRLKKTTNSRRSVKQELAEKLSMQNEFILLFRGLIASVIYFIQIPYFGSIMFAVIIIMILSSALMLFLKYQAFEIFREFASFIEEDTDDRMKPKKIIVP